MPQDNELAIDLRQTAVVIMAHLDRLATPCMPPQCSSPTSHKVSCSKYISFIFLYSYGIVEATEASPAFTLHSLRHNLRNNIGSKVCNPQQLVLLQNLFLYLLLTVHK